MNKIKTLSLIIFILLQLTGCASLKYPNWEQVNVTTTVDNKPCLVVGSKEQCQDSRSDCETWFKKRATIVKGNTARIVNEPSVTERFTGIYFQCKSDLPLYKEPIIVNSVDNQPCVRIGTREHCDLNNECNNWFKGRAMLTGANTIAIKNQTGRYFQCKAELPPYKAKKFEYRTGNNTITGQAFLRQRGGGVVTCAGKTVSISPNYDLYDEINFSDTSDSNPDKTTQCDAQGNFEFHKMTPGEWLITVDVSWDVSSIEGIPLPHGTYYYIKENKQGGILAKEVTVKDGDINKFIISQ